jgi:hypothetical protein
MRVAIALITAIFSLFQGSPPADADEILTQLSKIQIDKKQIHNIRDITIRRDALTIALNRGVIAFFEPIQGRVTGAVFIGSGEIVAIPPDATEKQQIYKFTGTPILNEAFQTAVLRFTDNTFEEITQEISQHAQEDVSAEDIAQFDSVGTSLASRATVLNFRLLSDFLEPANKRTFFLGELNGDRRGWFDVVFDTRATEEVSIFQVHDIGGTTVADIWASFNQRSEARNPEAVAHEHKSPVDILSYEIEGAVGADNKIDAKTTMHLKARTDGARVLNFDIAPTLRIASIQRDTDNVPYYQYPNAKSFFTVLPPLKRDQELTLRFAYAGQANGREAWYPSQYQQTIPSLKSSISLRNDTPVSVFDYSGHKVAPASYHDQWFVEGLTHYLAAMSSETNDPGRTQLRKVLNDARNELKDVENAGPIWLGQRLSSTITPRGYRALESKGIWIIHMIRTMLRQDGPDPDAKFLALLQEFAQAYDGKAASTWDFRHVAEKYANKNLDWFFDQWVFSTGMPSYSMEYKIEGSGNELTVEGMISQTGVPDGFVMPVPIYADGEYLGTVQVGDSEGTFKFRLSKRPERVVIDPEMTILTASVQ